MTRTPLVIDAVISTFAPGGDLVDRVDRLRSQVRRVIVVDDGSPSPWDFELAPDVEVVRLGENSGIAAALNCGVSRCVAAGADAVLTLDQDSDLPADGVARLADALVSSGANTGFVAPEFFAGVSQVARIDERNRALTRRTIQSGMLIPARTWSIVGLLNEGLFIDLVDTEFEMRCRSHGLDGVAAPGLRLGHRLGAHYRPRGWLGRTRIQGISSLTLSTPFRYYYRVRNRVLLNRAWIRGSRWSCLRDSVIDVGHFVSVISVARPRRAMWRLMRQAVVDGFRGRTGRLPDDLADLAQSVQWAADVMEAQR